MYIYILKLYSRNYGAQIPTSQENKFLLWVIPYRGNLVEVTTKSGEMKEIGFLETNHQICSPFGPSGWNIMIH